MRFYITVFAVILSLIYISYGEDLRFLLKKYEEEADLSNKTIKESIGHVIVFTRKDLEIMQAYTLGDVLRSFPLTNFLLNNFGIRAMTVPGTPVSIPIIYRLYIDNHEVSSIHTSSPFLIYDNYPLDNIDHIEVYCSLGAISVSNQPSQMIIKLYTKDANRENIKKGRFSVDTEKGYTFNYIDAKQLDKNSSYLLTVSRSYLNYKPVTINSRNVSRDQMRTHLFLKYTYFDSTVEMSFSDVKRGIFTGFSSDRSPDGGKMISTDGYINLTQKLLKDKSLKIFASYDFNAREYKELNSQNDGGIFFVPLYNPSDPLTYYHEKRRFHKYSLTVEKLFKNSKNKLLTGFFSKYHKQDLKGLEAYYGSGSKISKDDLFYVKYYRSYSGYIENSFNLNERNLIIAGLRFDNHKFSNRSSHSKLNLRAGFVSLLGGNTVIKGFISKFNIIPSMFNIELAKNHYLKDLDVNVGTLEFRYTKKDSIFKLYYKRCIVGNTIITDPNTKELINNPKTIRFNVFSFRYIHNINLYNKLELNLWMSDKETTYTYSPKRGGFLKLFTEYKKFQMYNEIIYRGKYDPYGIKISERIDYNISLAYRLPYEWFIKIKGENILNRAVKISYKNPFGEEGTIPVYDRKLIFTIEKVF